MDKNTHTHTIKCNDLSGVCDVPFMCAWSLSFDDLHMIFLLINRAILLLLVKKGQVFDAVRKWKLRLMYTGPEGGGEYSYQKLDSKF